MKTMRFLIICVLAVTVLLTLSCAPKREAPRPQPASQVAQDAEIAKLKAMACFPQGADLNKLSDVEFDKALANFEALQETFSAERKVRGILRVGDCNKPVAMDDSYFKPQDFSQDPDFLPVVEFLGQVGTICVPAKCKDKTFRTVNQTLRGREVKVYYPFQGYEEEALGCLVGNRQSWTTLIETYGHIQTSDDHDKDLWILANDLLRTSWNDQNNRWVLVKLAQQFSNDHALREQVLNWALGEEIAYLNTRPVEERKLVIEAFQKWLAYLQRWDHAREKKFLADLSKDSCDVTKYKAPDWMSAPGDCQDVFTRFDPDGKVNPLRKFVAWSYRRAENGEMTIADQVEVLKKVLSALQAGGVKKKH